MSWLVVTVFIAANVEASVHSQEAESIDGILESVWKSEGIEANPLASDAQFLRRATLDLTGRIPTLDEYNAFKLNPDRNKLVETLIGSDEFSRFFAETWTANFVGYIDAEQADREVLRAWLQRSIADGVSYQKIASDIISADGTAASNGPVNFLLRHEEDPAVKICRLFLGVRLDCARCHDHPFARWTQDDFEQMSRFFELTDRREISPGNPELFDNIREAAERPLEERPRFLTGARPRTRSWRDELALFATTCKPFARTYANRMWYHFFGRGIVEPIDDFSESNPAVIPQLLEHLASKARAQKFDVREMARLICRSRAYQRSSVGGRPSGEKLSVLFGCQNLKPLSPGQLLDSSTIATGQTLSAAERKERILQMVGEDFDEDFSQTWQYRETVQVLLEQLARASWAGNISLDDLFRRVLSREPTDRERKMMANVSNNDVLFVLMNSNEFRFNH